MKKKKEIEGLNQKRIDRMITVTDDWYPCFEGNKVQLSMFVSYVPKMGYHFVRVCVWGADDFGMELDYVCNDYQWLLSHYDLWKKYIFDRVPENVNKEWFYEHGFREA